MDKTTKTEQLEKRLLEFSSDILKLVKSLPKTPENKIYGSQILRASSSIGANFAEATCAHTKKDFTHDMNKSRKESKETIYWLKLISEGNPPFREKIKKLSTEALEIFKIFSSAVKTAKEKS